MHRFPIRVYYEDTDVAGIVYYANYLKFAERARTEMLREKGIQQSALFAEHGTGFVVRRCEVDFLKPARFDDLLTIETQIHDIGRVTIAMQQRVCRGDDVLVTLAVKIAVIGSDHMPRRLPKHIADAIMNKM